MYIEEMRPYGPYLRVYATDDISFFQPDTIVSLAVVFGERNLLTNALLVGTVGIGPEAIHLI